MRLSILLLLLSTVFCLSMGQDDIKHVLAWETITTQLNKLVMAIRKWDVDMIARLYYFKNGQNVTGVLAEFEGCQFEVEQAHFITRHRIDGFVHSITSYGEKRKYEAFLTRKATSPTDWNISMKRLHSK